MQIYVNDDRSYVITDMTTLILYVCVFYQTCIELFFSYIHIKQQQGEAIETPRFPSMSDFCVVFIVKLDKLEDILFLHLSSDRGNVNEIVDGFCAL